MSFTGLQLQGFKCFADSGYMPLAPLTLLFGRNNSGKSSVLQGLLLLRQSLDAPSYEPRLRLDGSLYSAGTFTDIVHLHRPNRTSQACNWTPLEAMDPAGKHFSLTLRDIESGRFANFANFADVGGLSREQLSVIHIGRGSNGAGKAVPLTLDALGQVENWPSGFHQEATEERMALLEEMGKKLEESE